MSSAWNMVGLTVHSLVLLSWVILAAMMFWPACSQAAGTVVVVTDDQLPALLTSWWPLIQMVALLSTVQRRLASACGAPDSVNSSRASQISPVSR